MRRCLFCYQELNHGETDFHAKCSRKFFGHSIPPQLPYTREHINELAKEVIRSHTTVTGVQPKLSLDLTKAHKNEPPRLTIVGIWGRYILKPQTEIFNHLPELEDVTMHLAQIAKINVVPHSLIRFQDGELCYITRRIDRLPNGDKIQMEDMCQLTNRLTEQKYKGSYEQIAKTILQFSATPKLDLINFWEQVLFSWMTGHADMHLKNFSLYRLIDHSYSLTPAYDLLSTALAMPEDPEELALTLNGKKRKIIKIDFITAMKKSGLDAKVIENSFNRLMSVFSQWHTCIQHSFLPPELQNQYIELIKNRLEILTDQ
jgi:serine/threonine-protein kinase HipA